MSLSSRQAVFARNVGLLIEFIFSHDGHGVTFGEAWRPADVAEIYEKQGRGIRNSLHCKRLAIGVRSPEGALAPMGSMWLNIAGGDNTTLYIKTSGTGNTGWKAVPNL